MTMVGPSPVRVVVVEDDRRFRSTLQTLFESAPEFALVDAFESAVELLERIEHTREPPPWDLVVMDIDLPDMSGIEATRRLKAVAPELPVVNLTVFDVPSTILQAIQAGADGYLLKSTPVDEVIEQLLAVTNGGSSLTPIVARTILELMRAPKKVPVGDVPVLSEREQETLSDMARGLGCKQIAAERNLSVHTVRTYVRRVYEKLQVGTSAEAVARAIRAGLV
jgi:DNA-binding NarL/FixJ family response regulator